MGVEDVLPTDIDGYQCHFCDEYEQIDYPVGMLAFPNPSYAHFALMALAFNKDFTIYSNEPVPTDEPTQMALKKVWVVGIGLDRCQIRRLISNGDGPKNGISIEFKSGSPMMEAGNAAPGSNDESIYAILLHQLH
ncbi:hypothetical protein TrVFT333_005988 [Trichoderma virens FT-333]|nr:hypothetical protein TrVFT333_005988 [Trichoderma virens FT-333]